MVDGWNWSVPETRIQPAPALSRDRLRGSVFEAPEATHKPRLRSDMETEDKFRRRIDGALLGEGVGLRRRRVSLVGGLMWIVAMSFWRLQLGAIEGAEFGAREAASREASPLAGALSFVNDVEPILTKASCNSGGCHAKAGVGQRGFRLSVLGFEPQEDYEHIVKEGKGRRVFPAAPEQSLLLLKATNTVPHGGGKKVEPGSEEHATLVRWISQGMPYGRETDPKIVRLEVEPSRISLKTGATQRLRVKARYSDGSERDVTRTALYEANDKAMAEASEDGEVKIQDVPGNVAVMVRYSGLVSVCSISIPLGAPVDQLPMARNFIDELVFSNLKKIGVPPSQKCDDATFLRRASLDIAGHLPTVSEARAFLGSSDPNKRDVLVESLLKSSGYADFFAGKWTMLLHNKRDATDDITANFAFHAWVRDHLTANTRYDQMVRELLGASGRIVSNPAVAWYKRVKDPQQQVEDVAQLFLGVRMQCAQCHHHPFERWSQRDYYSFAAFFSQVGRKPTGTAGEDVIFHKRGIAQAINKKSMDPVKPAGLGGAVLEIAPDEDPRLWLADWMSEKQNPFFAKALVNRYWKHFFRRGLIDPEDDIRDSNPPTNPELLEALAKHFVDSGYDLRGLVRTITQSTTYQLSSVTNAHNGVDQQNYSRYYPKRLAAEVLLDSVDGLTGSPTNFVDLPTGTRAISLPDNSYNRTATFLKVFGRPEGLSVCECERVESASLAQSLHLMNSAEIRSKVSAENGRADRLSRAGMSNSAAIEDLYLAAFSRFPTPAERQEAETYLARSVPDEQGETLDPLKARRQSMEDLVWALMNAKEFLYNH
jgi:hypothetical protein